MKKIHEIKTYPNYFQQSLEGKKPWEIRLNDRNYQVVDSTEMEGEEK